MNDRRPAATFPPVPPARRNDVEIEPRPLRKRTTTVYDAAAGRITSNGFFPSLPTISRDRDTVSTSSVPIAPDEALFKRKRAPERFEENDPYFADRKLPAPPSLPDSDLLTAVHAYASDFFAVTGSRKSRRAWRSLDETALLALGILLEEVATSTLGETGELAFIEGDQNAGATVAQAWNGASWARSVISRSPVADESCDPVPGTQISTSHSTDIGDQPVS